MVKINGIEHSEDFKEVLGKHRYKNNSKKNIKLSLLDLIKENNDFDSNLAQIIILDKLVDNYESKDIIPRNMSKGYALLRSTNKVQKDLIDEIISKGNDNKGQSKKMYFDIIIKTLDSIKSNEIDDKKGFFDKFKLR